MKTSIYFGLLLVGIYLFSSCDDKESDIIPTACFEASTYKAAVGETINFSNCSVDGSKYGWNFGDNTTSTEITPSHSYDYPGTYTVQLTAYNKANTDTYSKNIEVAEGGSVTLSSCFSVSASTAAPFADIHFTNCSSGAVSYEWNFGDGSTSEITDPTHYYSTIGTYTVYLYAYDANGNSEYSIKTITITNDEIIVDPTVYDGFPSYYKKYAVDFSTDPGEWPNYTDTEGRYTKLWDSTNGYYKIDVFDESGWNFWTNSYNIPSDDINYDIDIYMDFSGSGAAFFWGADTDLNKYQYNMAYDSSVKKYYVGYYHETNASWINWIFAETNYILEDYFNLLTVRNYNGKVYVFMNEVYVGSYVWDGKFGDKLGFYVGATSSAYISYISVHELGTSAAKSTNKKVFKGTSAHNKSLGTSEAQSSNIQVPLR